MKIYYPNSRPQLHYREEGKYSKSGQVVEMSDEDFGYLIDDECHPL